MHVMIQPKITTFVLYNNHPTCRVVVNLTLFRQEIVPSGINTDVIMSKAHYFMFKSINIKQ